jgi:hypothetical protein
LNAGVHVSSIGPALSQSGRQKFEDSTEFLRKLRPEGPWTLTAIEPDGPIITRTFGQLGEARKFLAEHDGTRNLYYSVNPTKRPVGKKATKADIAAADFVHADLDPHDDEASDAAKERYLKAISQRAPKPTAIVDSGNGIQALGRLEPPVQPGNFDLVEVRNKEIMLALGGTAETFNIDRILRLPGTTNLPNKKKQKAGRIRCATGLLEFSNVAHPLDAFGPWIAAAAKQTVEVIGAQRISDDDRSDEDELLRTISDGGAGRHGASRSEAVFYVVCEMLRRGYASDAIAQALLDRANRISDHIYDQSAPRQYAERQVREAVKKLRFKTDGHDLPRKSPENIRIALAKAGWHCVTINSPIAI